MVLPFVQFGLTAWEIRRMRLRSFSTLAACVLLQQQSRPTKSILTFHIPFHFAVWSSVVGLWWRLHFIVCPFDGYDKISWEYFRWNDHHYVYWLMINWWDQQHCHACGMFWWEPLSGDHPIGAFCFESSSKSPLKCLIECLMLLFSLNEEDDISHCFAQKKKKIRNVAWDEIRKKRRERVNAHIRPLSLGIMKLRRNGTPPFYVTSQNK